jgi:hypothetical protein
VRLADLTPEGTAAEVVEAVLEHLARYAVPLSPGVEVHVGPSRGDTGLGCTVADLTRYAQTGDTADWGSDAGALDAAQEIHGALYGRPADLLGERWQAQPEGYGEPEDPSSAIGVVLRAAEGRRRIVEGSPVPRRWLSALAGVDRRTITREIERGTLAVLRGKSGLRPGRAERQIAAAEALRWLATRVLGADGAAELERARAGWRYECGGGAVWLRVTGGVAVAAVATERGWTREGKAWVARSRQPRADG